MTADYRYGDGKVLDAANFGIFKQNWLMIRTAHPAYAKLSDSNFHTGSALNTDLALDIAVLHESQRYFGSKWFAGHRNGATGLANPNTSDINDYTHAVMWIKSQLKSNPFYLKDNTRFWVYVPRLP